MKMRQFLKRLTLACFAPVLPWSTMAAAPAQPSGPVFRKCEAAWLPDDIELSREVAISMYCEFCNKFKRDPIAWRFSRKHSAELLAIEQKMVIVRPEPGTGPILGCRTTRNADCTVLF